jgi:hypothetical protein
MAGAGVSSSWSTMARASPWPSSPIPRSSAPGSPQLDRLLGEHGKPKTIVSDNGTDLTLQRADDHTRRALALNIEEDGFLRGASSPCHSGNVDVPVFF